MPRSTLMARVLPTQYVYVCCSCQRELLLCSKIKTGAKGYSMEEVDRVRRTRVEWRYYDDQWQCWRNGGQRFVEGVHCSPIHPDSACHDTKVEEKLLQLEVQ